MPSTVPSASRLLFGASSLLFCSCIDTSTVLRPDIQPVVDADEVADRAEDEFDRMPRTEATVLRAFLGMKDAVSATPFDDSDRYERAVLAARYGIWLARHGEEDQKGDRAWDAILLCNTAIDVDPEEVEGYYYRAIATGLVAQQNSLYGMDAMSKIRADARTAIEIDDEYDDGGPHRVLGALYLFAPGPPAGVGSLRRAVRHLQAAIDITDDHPDNLLFLATAYLEAERDRAEIEALLERAREAIDDADEPEDRASWREELRKLRLRLGGNS